MNLGRFIMIVTEYLDINKPMVLTAKEIAELDEAAKHPIVYDEDCPPVTDTQIQQALTYIKNRCGIAV